MRIGLLITSVGSYGEIGFYNSQELGLAKELDKLFDEIIIYKAVPFSEETSKENIDNCNHTTLYQIAIKSKGINGVWDCSVMDTTLDALIFFSDTQLAVPNVYRWCCRNNIQMYPYIGVVESHSTNALKRFFVNIMFRRNLAVYKKCACFVKTPIVAEKLKVLGVRDTILTPVGLDTSLLHADQTIISSEEIKMKYGYQNNDKILLFIGRLIEEKQPVRMVEILSEIRKRDESYKLLMVGTGELKATVEKRIKELGLTQTVRMIERIPNSEIWELYRMADTFINLNQQEIFGMAILEAMYYGCKVVAWKAPGPSFIIEDGKSGFLVEGEQDVVEKICKDTIKESCVKKRILSCFTWIKTAEKIANVLKFKLE